MKTFLEWNIEAILILVHFPSNLLKPFVRLDSVKTNSTQKHSIVLVERWFSRNVFHLFAKRYLEKKGFRVYSLNYPMTKGSFEDSAVFLKKYLEEKNLSNVILIGISGGATTCLDYLQNMNGWQKTNKFISVGGSLRGSPYAKIFPNVKSMRELVPNSEYLKRLYKNPVKHFDRIITISALHDNMVPGQYSRIKGGRNITVNMVGHNLLHTFWLPTYRTIVKLAQE